MADKKGGSTAPYWTLVVSLIIVTGVGVVAGAGCPFSLVSSRSPLSAAGALAAISGGSIAIERSIEIFWTVMDLFGRGNWPTGVAFQRLTNLVEQIQKLLDDVKKEIDPTVPDASLPQLKARIDALNTTLTSVETLFGATFPSSRDVIERLRHLLTSLGNNLDPNALGDAENDIALVQTQLDAIAANPARRLVSILMGTAAGALGAWLLGLDVFSAVNAPPTIPLPVHPNIWIALTGLVMGLGATPTHELISFLQKRKNSPAQITTDADTEPKLVAKPALALLPAPTVTAVVGSPAVAVAAMKED